MQHGGSSRGAAGGSLQHRRRQLLRKQPQSDGAKTKPKRHFYGRKNKPANRHLLILGPVRQRHWFRFDNGGLMDWLDWNRVGSWTGGGLLER